VPFEIDVPNNRRIPSWYTWLAVAGISLLYIAMLGMCLYLFVVKKRQSGWRAMTIYGNQLVSDTAWQSGQSPPAPDQLDKLGRDWTTH
jgi:hypothetical protein